MLYSELNVLDLNQLFVKTILLYAIKNSKLKPVTSVYSARSEEAGLVEVPRMYTAAGQRSIVYLASKIFNILPTSLRASVNQNSFQSKLKTFLNSDEGVDAVGRLSMVT